MQSSAYSVAEMVDALVAEHSGQVGPLIPVLHGVQERMGFVPPEAIPLIARSLGLSRAEVHGVMHFYHDFRNEPAGDHVIQLCRAEACQAMGARVLETHVKAKLGIDYGQTSADGRFTLEPVYCLGNCACGPSVRIDDGIHAQVNPGKFDRLLDQLTDQVS